MFRRLTVLVAALCAAGALAVGPAVAAPADDQDLTPKEKAGLEVVGQVVGALLGLPPLGGDAVR
ncbi:hypothetical protein [Streptomyces catenulae]|uniref:Secreted protein n=1 Tax=Streptomyces catenulae TaxID=66875 RepID=A0ABV2Z732_9ACTN|nr:hypothetical protein [Streptomyces catenulae]